MGLLDGILGNVLGAAMGGGQGNTSGGMGGFGGLVGNLTGGLGAGLGGMTGNMSGGMSTGMTGGGANPLGSILGGITAGNAAGPSSALLLTAALGLIQQSGGLNGLLQRFEQNGLGAHAASWVAGGPNQTITPNQLEQVVGSSNVAGVASQLGVSPGQASSAMSQILPELVNQMTPHGAVPDGHDEVVTRGLEMLKGGAAQ